MPDTSYFQGRYYLYYGVTPAFLLFLPFRVLTGRFISEPLATDLFACTGFILSVLFLDNARRRHFSQAPAWAVAVGILSLGLGDLMPVLLRRPGFREVPIVCGYACCMAGLTALLRALGPQRRNVWLALASLALGLAVGSRPLYLLACPAVLVPVWLELQEEQGANLVGRPRFPWRSLFAALIPMGFVGLGLALYNFGRFGSFTEFGLRYQLWNQDPARTVRFAWRFLAYNLHAFWTAPAAWTPYFPFVNFVKLPPAPAGFYGAEDPYGILPNMPYALLALALIGLWLRSPPERDRHRPIAVIVAGMAAAMALPMLFFQAALIRYMLDFTPLVILAASLGVLTLTEHEAWRGRRAAAGAVLVCGLAGYSALFNVLASWRHNELFRAEHPALYARVARRWNQASHVYDGWRGTQYGPLELKVIFPADRTGAAEPFVVTGREFLSDYLFVSYPSPGSIQFGLEHTSRGTFLGQPLRIAPGKVHDVRVDLGSLYPPAAHPYFDAMPAAEAFRRAHLVRVTVDGQLALYDMVPTYDAITATPPLGTAGDRGPLSHPFSGRILSQRRLPGAGLGMPGWNSGPVRLELKLPPFTGPRDEPLLATGEPGKGDLVFLHYDSPTRVAFGYVHGKSDPVRGPLTSVNPLAVQRVDISFSALDSAALARAARIHGTPSPGLLVVRLDGRPAFRSPTSYFPVDAGTIALGINTAQAPNVAETFTGNFLSVRPAPRPDPEATSGPYHLDVRFPPFSGVRSEPLVCAGETGRGDVVYVRYLGPGSISFGYDHWGAGGSSSEPCPVDPLVAHVVEIDFGSLHSAGPAGAAQVSSLLRVRLDGRIVLDQPALFYPALPDSIAVCLNPIGASSTIPGFTGELLDAWRGPEAP